MKHSTMCAHSNDSVGQQWNVIADLWTVSIRRGEVVRKNLIHPKLLEILGDVKDRTVVDVGSGEGEFCRILRGRGARVIGIDISKRLIELARKQSADTSERIEYIRCDAARLSAVIDENVSIITMVHSLMCIPDGREVLIECGKVLGERGQLVFSIHHPCFVTTNEEVAGGIEAVDVSGWNGRYLDEFPLQLPCLGGIAIPVYHRSLSAYSEWLAEAGFIIRGLFELATAMDSEQDARGGTSFQLIVDCLKQSG